MLNCNMLKKNSRYGKGHPTKHLNSTPQNYQHYQKRGKSKMPTVNTLRRHDTYNKLRDSRPGKRRQKLRTSE